MKGKEEPKVKIATVSGCQSLSTREMHFKNDQIKSLVQSGVILIAKEAEYHKSCRTQFDKETQQTLEDPKTTAYQHHKSAFSSLCSYIERDVLDNQQSALVSELLDMYKAEYIMSGGNEKDIASYSSQNFLRKVNDKFCKQIRVTLLDQRNGNMIHSSLMTEEVAGT